MRNRNTIKNELYNKWFNFFIILILFIAYTILIFVIDQNFSARIDSAKETKIHEYRAQISSLITLNRKLADVYFI